MRMALIATMVAIAWHYRRSHRRQGCREDAKDDNDCDDANGKGGNGEDDDDEADRDA